MLHRILRLLTRRRRRFAIGVTAAVGIAGVFAISAFAVHDTGRFELDGNAVNQSATPGDDWDNVCHEVTVTRDTTNSIPDQCPSAADTNGATAVSWSAELNLNSSIFTGGGSKDPSDINQWAWKDGAGGLPDKDNLLHDFAARYSLTPSTTCPSTGTTCEVLYFGSDRYDNSGDAQQGFWFFQNEISLGNGSVGGGTSFNGVHKNGDLLVISDFSNGGTTSTITVYQWNTACTKAGQGLANGHTCGDANLEQLATSDNANCGKVGAADSFCGIVDPTDGTPAPWTYTDKSGKSSYLQGELYEGGVNLSALGLADRCFASVASETRSSTSTTAVLKDFILGKFGSCSTSLVTTPGDGSGGALSGPLTIPKDPNDAAISVRDRAQVSVNGTTSFAGSVAFSLCGPTATSSTATCTSGGVSVGSTSVTTNGTVLSPAATVTSAGRYCWRGVFTSTTSGVPPASDSSAGECFTVNPVKPTIATQAGATVDFGQAVTDTATLTGTAHKPGSGGPTGSTNGSILLPLQGTLGGDATGLITFTLYKDDHCGSQATGTGANPQTATVSGDGNNYTAGFTPDAPGTYYWVASYGGDGPNTLASDASACNDPAEAVIVRPIPTQIKTRQTWVPNDTATISATAGNLGADGTVAFGLYGSSDCSGSALYTESKTLTGGAPSETVGTTNTGGANGFEISTAFADPADSLKSPYAWKVVYTPAVGDAGHTGKQSACNAEHFSISYTNSNGPGSNLP
jgi:hypothetical protein